MELRAHAMNAFRSHYTHDGRGNWNKELEAEVGSQIDHLLESKRQKKDLIFGHVVVATTLKFRLAL